ncbi:centrosomal protein of 70 kDa-like isoform X3 [Pomacea canaliculata]|uniref:centrosomal protein of 70 kDa-like isoform X3 n=1 Tax=Pomacea canaliculata TaxID=400727 RepID=UPI000D725292|nr:centrosomal protein of 70 kDa-like isoform X3 [Pomacea canaliculata]
MAEPWKSEKVEWAEVSNQLRKCGLQDVRILAASNLPFESGYYVCLDLDNSQILRHNILSLVRECQHQQSLIQDLMDTNHHLREDAADLKQKAEKFYTRLKDTKVMLECSRVRVQELEKEKNGEHSHHAEEGKKERNLHNNTLKHCQQLEAELSQREVELDTLHKKIHLLQKQEEKRISRQNKVFQDFMKHTARAHSVMDGKLLDVIDVYEKQLSDLKQQLDLTRLREQVINEADKPLSTSSSSEARCSTQQIIGAACKELGVNDAEKLVPAIQQLLRHMARNYTVEQKLRVALNQLLGQVLPRARIHLTGDHTVKRMAEIIDDLAKEETTNVSQDGWEHISRTTLESIVKHFQSLFDVSSVSGILPRMNELYQHLGEAQNVLNTLRHLLGLMEVSNSSVVDAVGRLCQMQNSTTSQYLQQLFETDDLGRILMLLDSAKKLMSFVIRRLDEHKQFFPAFRTIMIKLLDILGVERMDQVIPAVRALKLLSN